jgi:hypothetical protein
MEIFLGAVTGVVGFLFCYCLLGGWRTLSALALATGVQDIRVNRDGERCL